MHSGYLDVLFSYSNLTVFARVLPSLVTAIFALYPIKYIAASRPQLIACCFFYVFICRATHNLYQLVLKHQKAKHDEVDLEETNEQLNRVSTNHSSFSHDQGRFQCTGSLILSFTCSPKIPPPLNYT